MVLVGLCDGGARGQVQQQSQQRGLVAVWCRVGMTKELHG